MHLPRAEVDLLWQQLCQRLWSEFISSTLYTAVYYDRSLPSDPIGTISTPANLGKHGLLCWRPQMLLMWHRRNLYHPTESLSPLQKDRYFLRRLPQHVLMPVSKFPREVWWKGLKGVAVGIPWIPLALRPATPSICPLRCVRETLRKWLW